MDFEEAVVKERSSWVCAVCADQDGTMAACYAYPLSMLTESKEKIVERRIMTMHTLETIRLKIIVGRSRDECEDDS